MDFPKFPKIARLSREVVITEKIDGTNASIHIVPLALADITVPFTAVIGGYAICAGSRNRWIAPDDDNYGFAKWVKAHAEELATLGEGSHYGEWWGNGIQRGYGLKEKRFSLFNVGLWNELTPPPACCSVVPVLSQFIFDTAVVDSTLMALAVTGSHAAPEFMRPEGVMIYHIAGGHYFKKTFDGDNAKG